MSSQAPSKLPYDPVDWERRLAAARLRREQVLGARADREAGAPPAAPAPGTNSGPPGCAAGPGLLLRHAVPLDDARPSATGSIRRTIAGKVVPEKLGAALAARRRERIRTRKAMRALRGATRSALSRRRLVWLAAGLSGGFLIGLPFGMFVPRASVPTAPDAAAAHQAAASGTSLPGIGLDLQPLERSGDTGGTQRAGDNAPPPRIWLDLRPRDATDGAMPRGGEAGGTLLPAAAGTRPTEWGDPHGAVGGIVAGLAPDRPPDADRLHAGVRLALIETDPSDIGATGTRDDPARVDLAALPIAIEKPPLDRDATPDAAADDPAPPAFAAPVPIPRPAARPAQRAEPGPEGIAGTPERVVVHVPRRAAHHGLAKITFGLQDAGVSSWQRQPVSVAVSETHLRYYHPDDAEAARKLARTIGVEVRDFTGHRPAPEAGLVEIWVAGE